MLSNPLHSLPSTEHPFFVWVLAPHLITNDAHIDYYYDFSQSIEEYTRAFEQLELQWKWQPVTIDNYKIIIDEIADKKNFQTPIVLNLCDGDEVNGTPGVSVIHYLKEKQLIYTGSEPAFYDNTTSKIIMKELFDKAGIPHAAWAPIHHSDQPLDGICDSVCTPLIVKPAVSGGSMGLGVKNVVQSTDELKSLVKELFSGYRGWDFTFGGLVAEQFINGPEYTVFISGSYLYPRNRRVYVPVERIFHKDLPDTEKFLSFDRLWETYEAEKGVGQNEDEDFYQYSLPPATLHKKIMDLSWKAYCAVGGTGYGRVDIRMDKTTGKLYVLEVNAQCGLSEDENYTSIGAILRLGNETYSNLILHILQDALQRHTVKQRKTVAARQERA
jgi:D-alanine-D-alanine ligase